MRSFGDDDLSNSAGRSLVNCFMTIPINIQHEILGFVCDVRVILSCSQHYSASNSLFNPPSFQTTLVSKTNTNNYSLLLNTERGKNRITLRITSPFHTYLQNIVDTPLRPLGETLLSDTYIKQDIQTNLKCNCSQDE